METLSSSSNTDLDIAICGAGPVGQALALLLCKQGIPAGRIALFDAKTAAQAEQDARTIALSYGSRQILDNASAWPIKATAILQIHVSRRGHFGRSFIDSKDYHVPALGYVARYGDIIAPLQSAIQRQGIRVYRPVMVEGLQESDDRVSLHLHAVHTEDEQQSAEKTLLSANIAVQAEGGTFTDQSQRSQRHDYQQTALIAHITCSAPIAGRAFERFTDQGPVALLPQDDGYALVWCARPATAEQLLALDDAAFRSSLQQAFGHRLGQIQRVSKRLAYPLGLNAQTHATARTVSIGNAAQTLHPVAGQGLNLGLRDAFVLAQCLSRHADQPQAALQDFIAARKTDRQTTIRLTDTLARIFASSPDGSASQSLLGLGLSLLDMVEPLKGALARQMMYGWR